MYVSPHSAVICAAGAGTRMGCPKALCLLGVHTFLSSIVETLHEAGIFSVIVVIGAEAQRVRQMHDHLAVTWVLNADWASTFMLESLMCGMQFVPHDHAVIHWPVDCVDVHVNDVRRLMAAKEPLVSLAFEDGPGHPMKMSCACAADLRRHFGRYNSLRAFVDAQRMTTLRADYPALMNCNTPECLSNYLKSRCPK